MQNELPFEPEPEPALASPVEKFDATEETEPVDCARMLAWHMLRAAMGKASQPLPLGLYIVHAPSEEWCPALKEALHDVYLGGPRRDRKRRRLGSGHPHIHVLDPLSAADSKQAAQISSKAQDILSHGMTVIVIASKLSAVPTALQRASERIIKVPPPRRQFVSGLVREIIPGARRLEFRDLACEMLTPSLLRLAYRRGTSARAFLRRLRTLTSPVTCTGSGKSIPLEKLHGVDEVKRWAMDLKADLTRYRRGELGWHEVTRGLLLAGRLVPQRQPWPGQLQISAVSHSFRLVTRNGSVVVRAISAMCSRPWQQASMKPAHALLQSCSLTRPTPSAHETRAAKIKHGGVA